MALLTIFIFLLVCCLLPLSYLYLLLLASLRKSEPLGAPGNLRFAVTIPAHNEEAVIAETLQAVLKADYPAGLVDVYLVADHCQDQTASIARRCGAIVFERDEPDRDGKGPALAWLFDRIFATGKEYDAFAILDADSRLDPEFFKVMSARLEAGSNAVQGMHIIRNSLAGWFPALTWAMFRIDNLVQNQGRVNLGFSAKNMGDSICFRKEIIRRLCWGEGLVDDYAFRQELLLHGVKIDYEPRAIGYGQAVANWSQAKTQRARWLLGTFQANRRSAGLMFKEGLRKRDLALLEGALSAYLPSYSTLALIIAPMAWIAWLLRQELPEWLPVLWGLTLILAIFYPFCALLLDRAPLRAFLVILSGPVYIVWRTGMAIIARYLRRESEWIRTPRQVEGPSPTSLPETLPHTDQKDQHGSILFLAQLLPYPLDAGPKTRAYYVIKHLTRSHQVTLLSFSRPSDTNSAVEHLQNLCSAVITVPMPRSRAKDIIAMLRSLLTNQPFLIERDYIPGMMRAIKKIVTENDFDYVHADQLWMVQYALEARRCAQAAGKKLRVVLDQHNAVYLIPKRLMAITRNPFTRVFLGRESRLLSKFEATVCRDCDQVVWVTAEDLAAIESLQTVPPDCSTIIPICVDPDLVKPPAGLTELPGIFFLGGMHWPPNAEGISWFVREVLPRIRQELPAAFLAAVGKSPPAEIIELEGILSPGFVEDVSAFWKENRVFIVPIQAAGGMRVKILDAWANGLPVVSTSIGAEGILVQPGINILIADDPAEFARCVIEVLSDDRLAQCLSISGRKTLEEHYDWKKVYCSWDKIYLPVG